MKQVTIDTAVSEAHRFLRAIGKLKARAPKDYEPCAERAAVRRASLDLSKALAAMRHSTEAPR